MPPNNSHQQFATVLASTIHDLKNSLGTVQSLTNRLAKLYINDMPDFQQLEFEVKRMNHSMMQLLALYRIDNDSFALEIDDYLASDILEEVEAQQSPQLHMSQINLTSRCPDELMVFCDFNHISNALGTILNNTQRYSRNHILLSASREDDYICFTIEDDGEGYPENLLSVNTAEQTQVDWVNGNTGLGLYFVKTIAALHRNQDQCGYIRLDNNSSLGGARFRLFLP